MYIDNKLQVDIQVQLYLSVGKPQERKKIHNNWFTVNILIKCYTLVRVCPKPVLPNIYMTNLVLLTQQCVRAIRPYMLSWQARLGANPPLPQGGWCEKVFTMYRK